MHKEKRSSIFVSADQGQMQQNKIEAIYVKHRSAYLNNRSRFIYT